MSLIIDSRQMECVRGREKGRCIFLSASPREDGEIVFTAEVVKYNEETQDNDDLGTEVFTGAEFSEWWKKKRKNGWRFCP